QRTSSSSSLLRQALVRLFLAALTAALFATLASCGCPRPDDAGIDVLSTRLEALQESVTDSREQAGQVALWQFIAAILLAAAGFALIGGAALGSIARRQSATLAEDSTPPTQPHHHPQPLPDHDHEPDEEF
ncbi:MAG: hypothetical protein KDL87_18895, partial [Verrucomicrobiae bacterium]|nr:hypothetical protein [Verrucomicrobiae bacterium]